MQYREEDTIVALSTPSGKGALGIIRMSGPQAMKIITPLFKSKTRDITRPRVAHYGVIHNEHGQVLDDCIVTIFEGPSSFSGEDVIEISCHGSPYIIRSIIHTLTEAGARPALPGEFSQRAFLNGKMDLSQAEAIGDLIASESAAQHALAMNQMKGGITSELNSLREKLIKFASLIELENDFSEEDVEFANREKLAGLVSEANEGIETLEASFHTGKAIKEGISVAIAGPPNAGKSTLLNTLLNEDRAIVSDIPGTTRDVIEDTIHLDGLLYRFIDTAGIRQSIDHIEQMGIDRSRDQISKASVILWVEDVKEAKGIIDSRFRELNLREDQRSILILNKSDTISSSELEQLSSDLNDNTIVISALSKSGIENLQEKLIQFNGLDRSAGHDVIISHVRHLHALRQTREHLSAVVENLREDLPSDLVAIDLRHALYHLGLIAGEISTDDLLESIFRDFCIGK